MKSADKAIEVSAPDLAKLAIKAHGGLDRWKLFSTVSVHGINDGVLWGPRAKPRPRSMSSRKFLLWRLGQSEDIARVVSFLAGLDGGWINSQVVRANGGFALSVSLYGKGWTT